MFGINNPQALLRPWKNLTQFAEELYAMCAAGEETPVDTPAEAKVRAQESAFKLSRDSSDTPQFSSPARAQSRREETLSARPKPEPFRLPAGEPVQLARQRAPESRRESDGPVSATSVSPIQPAPRKPSTTREARRSVPPRKADQPPKAEEIRRTEERRSEPSTSSSVGGPVAPETTKTEPPPKVFDQRTRQWVSPPPFTLPDTIDPAFAAAAGTTVFIGQVVSGTGDTYQVTLFQNGPAGSGDEATVEVTIPMIDPDETIDPDTWLYGIFQFTDADGNDTYTAQPPVWMA